MEYTKEVESTWMNYNWNRENERKSFTLDRRCNNMKWAATPSLPRTDVRCLNSASLASLTKWGFGCRIKDKHGSEHVYNRYDMVWLEIHKNPMKYNRENAYRQLYQSFKWEQVLYKSPLSEGSSAESHRLWVTLTILFALGESSDSSPETCHSTRMFKITW
jgi:hypothetical protein